jgi:hypothetical protein
MSKQACSFLHGISVNSKANRSTVLLTSSKLSLTMGL